MTVSCNLFLFLTVSVKRIEETKNRVKSDLEATIKATDSKHAEVVTAIVRDLVKEIRDDKQGMFRRLFANIYVLGRYTRRTTKS